MFTVVIIDAATLSPDSNHECIDAATRSPDSNDSNHDCINMLLGALILI